MGIGTDPITVVILGIIDLIAAGIKKVSALETGVGFDDFEAFNIAAVLMIHAFDGYDCSHMVISARTWPEHVDVHSSVAYRNSILRMVNSAKRSAGVAVRT